MKKSNVTRETTMAFAIRIVQLYQYLTTEKKEFVMSRQILKSGTSIGANTREAENAESDADFIHKLSAAQKEANETLYWLELLRKTAFISTTEFNSIFGEAKKIYAMITSSILTRKQNIAATPHKS
ncbi:MAG: four helix bundle protein [Saprospiraceae bacterium]